MDMKIQCIKMQICDNILSTDCSHLENCLKILVIRAVIWQEKQLIIEKSNFPLMLNVVDHLRFFLRTKRKIVRGNHKYPSHILLRFSWQFITFNAFQCKIINKNIICYFCNIILTEIQLNVNMKYSCIHFLVLSRTQRSVYWLLPSCLSFCSSCILMYFHY